MKKILKDYSEWLDGYQKNTNTRSIYYSGAATSLPRIYKDLSKRIGGDEQNVIVVLKEFLSENRMSGYKKITFNGIQSFEKFIDYKIATFKSDIVFAYPKKQIILQGPPGTGKTRQAKEIAYQLVFNDFLKEDKEERITQLLALEQSSQFKIIQFHPAYSYEDFVRGIKAIPAGNSIEYRTEDKVLAKIAKEAYVNFLDSKKDVQQLSDEAWLNQVFDEFKEHIIDEIEGSSGKLILSDTTTYLKPNEGEEDCFRYTGDNWNFPIGNKMYFSDLKEMFNQKIKTRQEIKAMTGISGLAKQHASYFIKVLDLFYKFIEGKSKPSLQEIKVEEKNFVLIIDEINRANLPSVLGELIYALEYRGEAVDSMYDIDGDSKIVLPPNLYIIGTMNTADRSVGHIDYAIRRRFAFVDVLPNSDVIENPKANEYFSDLQAIFKSYTAPDFEWKDVCLGHSYFIVKDDDELILKLQYEVLPILKEYLKDGILLKNENTEAYIQNLEQAISA